MKKLIGPKLSKKIILNYSTLYIDGSFSKLNMWAVLAFRAGFDDGNINTTSFGCEKGKFPRMRFPSLKLNFFKGLYYLSTCLL